MCHFNLDDPIKYVASAFLKPTLDVLREIAFNFFNLIILSKLRANRHHQNKCSATEQNNKIDNYNWTEKHAGLTNKLSFTSV